MYLISAAPDVSKTEMLKCLTSHSSAGQAKPVCVCVDCTVFPPVGQPVWPVSTDSPNVPLLPLPSSDYCQSLRDRDPVTSPSPI